MVGRGSADLTGAREPWDHGEVEAGGASGTQAEVLLTAAYFPLGNQ